MTIPVQRPSERLSAEARRAIRSKDWHRVAACAQEILRHDARSAEGHFLIGLVEKVGGRPSKAAEAFAQSLSLDATRHDAAVELADQYAIARRNGDAAALLARYVDQLHNSPRYLDMAGTIYSQIGQPEKAMPLYRRANELQPDISLFQANLAACGVYVGEIQEAKSIYQRLLERNPTHQRNHYHLSRLERARDDSHVLQMQAALRATNLPPDKNVFMYFAIGKELEDLGRWEEAFRYYQMACDAVASVAKYDVNTDVALIDRIIEVCDASWLATNPRAADSAAPGKRPIFVAGLPRTGSTLTERILASHSQVASIGETEFLQMTLRKISGVASIDNMNPAMIEGAARQDIGLVADGYMSSVAYLLGDAPMFIEKLPFNFLYLGFIAKAWPDAGILYVRRNPMDACFAMYKQVFTWAYKFSYSLEWLGRYYIAHHRLLQHWRKVLGERLVEVEYETLVADQENQTRQMLERLSLPFEPACLAFDKNTTATTTASSVQVREPMHARSVHRWKHFARELQPLREQLEAAGISVE
jgi:tetratricopeptide (TPR) repeat protein